MLHARQEQRPWRAGRVFGALAACCLWLVSCTSSDDGTSDPPEPVRPVNAVPQEYETFRILPDNTTRKSGRVSLSFDQVDGVVGPPDAPRFLPDLQWEGTAKQVALELKSGGSTVVSLVWRLDYYYSGRYITSVLLKQVPGLRTNIGWHADLSIDIVPVVGWTEREADRSDEVTGLDFHVTYTARSSGRRIVVGSTWRAMVDGRFHRVRQDIDGAQETDVNERLLFEKSTP